MKKLKSVHLVYDIDDGNATYTNVLAYDGEKYKNDDELLEELRADIETWIKGHLK